MDESMIWFEPPSMKDVRNVISRSRNSDSFKEKRRDERIELTVPAEIQTSQGNTIKTMTLNISKSGIGLLHRGPIRSEEVIVRMRSETREYAYKINLLWTQVCDNGMWRSGGKFVKQ